MKKILLTLLFFAFILQTFGQWIDISPTLPDQITKLWFKNTQEGYAVGKKIQYTNDSGQNWSQLVFLNQQIVDYSCLNNNNCYAAIYSVSNKYIIHSSDNWLTYDTIFQSSSQINCIKPVSVNEIFLGTDNGLLHTIDGFITIDTLLQGAIYDILNIHDSIFFAGNYRSFDYGYNWTLLPVQTCCWYGTFNSTNNIIVIFSFFTIYFSGDYGTTWATYSVPVSLGYYEPGDVLFLDSLNVLICGPMYHGSISSEEPGYQYLILSTDGVHTWTPIFSQTTLYDTDQMNSFVYFPNDTIFVGGTNKILRTYNPLTYNSVQYFEKSDILLYPNPASQNVELHYNLSAQESGLLEIFSVIGNKVASYVLTSIEEQVNISVKNFESSIYMYRFSVNGKLVEEGKLIIIHK